MKAPRGLAEVLRFYGAEGFSIAGGKVVIPAGWERAHMVSALLPGYEHKVFMHRLVVEPAQAAFERCVALGDGYRPRSIGCFNPRVKRSNPAQFSFHAFGAAFDLDPEENAAIANCMPTDPRRAWRPGQIPEAWIDEFRGEGFSCGADFWSYYDRMHVQLGWD